MHQGFVSAVLAAGLSLVAMGDVVGADDRIELRHAEPRVRALGRSVALHTTRHRLVKLRGPANPWTLLNSSKARVHGYCPETRFADQGVGGECTATLVGPDEVLLAGHCLEEKGPENPFDLRPRCESSVFVFDVSQRDDGTEPFSHLRDEQVYYCRSVRRFVTQPAPGKGLKDDGKRLDDYAFVKLDRAVLGGAPLPLPANEEEEVRLLSDNKRERIVLHHPHGVPQKVSPVGAVELTSSNVVRADIDVSRGSSGAPIVDVETGTVLAILKGVTYPKAYLEEKWDKERRCRVEFTFPDDERPVIAVRTTLGVRLKSGAVPPKATQ
jgi:hypothetical protein